jgi:hypothetical protein
MNIPNDGTIWFLGDKIPQEVVRMLIILPHISTSSAQSILSFVVKYVSGIPANAASTVKASAGIQEQQDSESDMISKLNQVLEQEVTSSLEKIPAKKKKRSELEHIEQAIKNGLFPVVFTGLYFILRSAIRQRLRYAEFVDQCTRLMMHEPVLKLVTQLYETKKEELIQVSKNRACWFNTVINVRWRVDITISTSVITRVFKPVLLLQLELSNGTVRTMEVSLQQFHELRLACATALNEMITVSNHPIMLIRERE